MLDKIIYFSIKNKLIIGLFVLALIAWGSYSVTRLSIDAVPDITNNQVQVITSVPSMSAQDAERLITFPIEQTMATIPGIEEIRSFSRFGLSVVTIVFEEDIDVYWARQQVNERMGEAKNQIPSGAGTPYLAPVTTGLGEIYQYVIHTKKGYENKFSAMELRTIQDWIVRRQLLGVEGVADVSSFGGFLKQYEIAIEPDRLAGMNVTVADIFTALEKNNQNTGGAYIDKKPNAYFIRSEGLLESIEDIEKIVVKSTADGTPVLIRNVAKVQLGHAVRYGAMTRNAEGEVVGAIVLMLKGANSSAVIKNVKARIAQIEKTLPEGVVIEPYLDRTKLVNKAIFTVSKNLVEGALIVIFVLVLLLGNLRAGLVVASVIPLAMLFAVSMMNIFGVSGNLMSLGAIDFGLIVDGAVIIVEATMHHLVLAKAGRKLNQQQMDEEVYESASKIRTSAAFGEIIILIVYLPILALVGVEGKMFKPLAQTVSFAILGAFILSLTYVPMMSALVLNKNIENKRNISDKIMDFFQKIYKPGITFALKNKMAVLIISAALFAGSLIIFSAMGAEFIPSLDEGDFAVETRIMTGGSLSQSVETATKASDILLKNFPEIIQIVGKIGSSEIPVDPMPIEATDLIIVLKDKDEWTSASTKEELAEKMGEALEALPGVTFGFQQPIQMRFNELMTGARQDVVVKVYGEDLEMLSQYGEKIGKLAGKVNGAEDIYIEKLTGLPQIVIKYNREKLAQFGLNTEDVNRVINAGFAGESAGLVFEGEKRFDLVIRLAEENRSNIEDIRNLYITTSTGSRVPLSQLADVEMQIGPNQIQRDDAKRRITVGFNVRGRDVESIVKELQQKIEKEVSFAPGYYVTFGGTFENLVQARNRLSVAVPVALFLIFILLFFTFGSVKYGLLIFTAIPLSAIGGVFALWLRGMPFSISAGIGFIALFGVAVLNGIVLIAEFNRLKKSGMKNLHKIILTGTSTRLRPVIMTAAVASLGFLPMALSNTSGAEVQRPLATVVIGGLVTATLLTLLVLPILYILFEKIHFRKPKSGKTSVLSLILISLFFSINTENLNAQSQNLTLEEAIRKALDNNSNIKSAGKSIDYQQCLKRTSTEIGKTNITLMRGQYNSINTDNSFTITQNIPFLTVFTSRHALGNARERGAELNLATTKNELIKSVKQSYYQLNYLQAYKQLLLRQDSIYSGFSKAASTRYRVGETNLLEKASAETQAMESKNQLQQNETNIQIYITELQTLLNSNEQINIAENDLKKREFNLATDEAVINQNPFLKLLKQEIEIAQKAKNVELSKTLPDFTLGYFNQSLIGYQRIDAAGTEVFYDASQRFTGLQFGISIPIWFIPDAARIKAASINKEISENNLAYAETNLKGLYKQAIQEYLKSKNSLEYYEKNALPNADLIITQSQKAFRAGEIGYVEYLYGIRNAIGVRSNYLNALNQYNQAVIQLEYLSGNE